MPDHGCYVWITGWSCTGKSTLARELTLSVVRECFLIDGDRMREARAGNPLDELDPAEPFSKKDRDRNVLAAARMGHPEVEAGKMVIFSLISPYQSARLMAYDILGGRGLTVHLHADLDVLRDRDVAGRYEQALKGDLPRFTGVNDPYDRPDSHEVGLSIDTGVMCKECALRLVLRMLVARGMLQKADISSELREK